MVQPSSNAPATALRLAASFPPRHLQGDFATRDARFGVFQPWKTRMQPRLSAILTGRAERATRSGWLTPGRLSGSKLPRARFSMPVSRVSLRGTTFPLRCKASEILYGARPVDKVATGSMAGRSQPTLCSHATAPRSAWGGDEGGKIRCRSLASTCRRRIA